MRLTTLTFLSFVLLYLSGCAQTTNIPNKEEQIASATMAAPADQRDGATVLGYDANGQLVTLREGTNQQLCIADDPGKEGFQVVCYHQDLEPFMARGRALRAEGKTPGEIDEMREAEAKAETLKMPEAASTLHILYGKEGKYNAESGEVENAHYRYVVYIPWATSESTGLPVQPIVPGGPWIMNPGTHKAHIMISPPKMEE